jgi:hypothetical protein
VAIKLLSYFVGDVHQPLHVAHSGDKHGSVIRGDFLASPTNLYEVWETGLIDHYSVSWYAIPDQLRPTITDEKRRLWTSTGPVDWANESLTISLDPRTKYVGQRADFDYGEEYETQNAPIMIDRLARAGVRLGHLLNELMANE